MKKKARKSLLTSGMGTNGQRSVSNVTRIVELIREIGTLRELDYYEEDMAELLDVPVSRIRQLQYTHFRWSQAVYDFIYANKYGLLARDIWSIRHKNADEAIKSLEEVIKGKHQPKPNLAVSLLRRKLDSLKTLGIAGREFDTATKLYGFAKEDIVAFNNYTDSVIENVKERGNEHGTV